MNADADADADADAGANAWARERGCVSIKGYRRVTARTGTHQNLTIRLQGVVSGTAVPDRSAAAAGSAAVPVGVIAFGQVDELDGLA